MKNRISITIDEKLMESIKKEYLSEVKIAMEKGTALPKLSNIYENILQRGMKTDE